MPKRYVAPVPMLPEESLRSLLGSLDLYYQLARLVYVEAPYNGRGFEVDWISEHLAAELPQTLRALARDAELARDKRDRREPLRP